MHTYMIFLENNVIKYHLILHHASFTHTASIYSSGLHVVATEILKNIVYAILEIVNKMYL